MRRQKFPNEKDDSGSSYESYDDASSTDDASESFGHKIKDVIIK